MKTIASMTLALILTFGPASAEEYRKCSDLVVSETLVNVIEAELGESGWPRQRVVASFISDEGIEFELEAAPSWIESHPENRPNIVIFGFPARVSTFIDAEPDKGLGFSNLFFTINGVAGGAIAGYVSGHGVGPGEAAGSSEVSGNTGAKRALALIYYPSGPFKSREFRLRLACKEYIYSDPVTTMNESRIFDLLIAIVRKDSEND